MEMATIVAKYVATTAAKYASDPALRHIGYFLMSTTTSSVLSTYVNDLQSKVQEDLLRLEHDVIGKVNLARDNGDVIHEVVQNWLNMVVEVRDEALILFNEAGAINSFFKVCDSASHRIGKESKEKIAIVENLLIEGRSFSSVSDPAPVPERVVEHFNAFASREATKKEVIQALMDDKTNLVGVYGTRGVGKTTLMKEIRKLVEETKLFDKNFWDAVIQQLKKTMCGGMSPVNASIKLSYDFLETSETKLCFLLYALFPEDHRITMDVLVGYAMGEDLRGEMATTAAKYVATTAAKYASDPALRHIGATTMEGAAIAVPIVRYISYVASTATQYAWDHISYFYYYQTYVNDLQRKVQEDLLRLEHDVIGKVNLF
ncbi:hypothetical protein GIB67_004124 [Kingdonia uniflora]|uniref:NB-ARC domain-containing protein n=1 Tax=Kingdonia uniflora TaxID=39325 RepID=A0A7J7NRY8_9MAGN|nr:hypothetical protein GIB67_004124 [Kingdonia uniflora]